MLKLSEMRELNPIDLRDKLEEVSKDLFFMNEKKTFKRLEKSHKIRELRRYKAQILTVINEKKVRG